MFRLALIFALFVSADSAFIGATMKAGFLEKIAKRSLEATVLPDPLCKTGVISLKTSGKPQSCCAGYCGECTDYPTCEKVRGQDSKNACCASAVYDMRCGNAPANACLKKCSEAVPPCIMDKDVFEIGKLQHNAADDCTSAIPQWRQMAENAIKAGSKEKLPYEVFEEHAMCDAPILYSTIKDGMNAEICFELCKSEHGCQFFTPSSDPTDPACLLHATCNKVWAGVTSFTAYKVL